MNYTVVLLGRRRVLISEPNNTSYGNLVMEVLMSLHMARKLNSSVFFITPSKPLNKALFHLVNEEIAVLIDGIRRFPLRIYWNFIRIGFSIQKTYRIFRTRIDKGIARLMGRFNKLLKNWYIKSLKSSRKDNKSPHWLRKLVYRTLETISTIEISQKNTPIVKPRGFFFGMDFRAQYARNPLLVKLSKDQEHEAARYAAKLGIHPTSKLVVLHVRESGYKQSTSGLYEKGKDSNRNADIETYFKAVDYLVDRGYSVVRIGDRSMRPVCHPGVIDLATSYLNADFLELWCFLKSDFFIGCDSGPNSTSLLTNVPSLLVNSINPIGAYPIREKDLYILKRAVDPATGRLLLLFEMLTEEFLFSTRHSEAIKYIDNTEEEILSAVAEMLKLVENGPIKSEPQRQYRELIQNIVDSPRVKKKNFVKAGIESPYIGDGRICHFYAARYLHGNGVADAAHQLEPLQRT